MKLLDWLKIISTKGGMSHAVAIQGLRTYLRETDERVVIDEIQMIHSIPLLRYLQEAGVPGSIYEAYIDHLGRIENERE